MRKREPKRLKLEDMPRCPECWRKKSVGKVRSVVEKRYKTGISFNCCEAYYCSECLIEWGEDGNIREPIYA